MTIREALVIFVIIGLIPCGVHAQDKATGKPAVFEKANMLVVEGGKVDQVPARIRLEESELVIEDSRNDKVLKVLKYGEMRSAEYSYSKHPRWKAAAGGVAVGAVVFSSLIFFALPVAIPLGFSKSKRHWLTIRTEKDYAVLRLDKRNQKVILPAFEVKSGVKVEAVGENK